MECIDIKRNTLPYFIGQGISLRKFQKNFVSKGVYKYTFFYTNIGLSYIKISLKGGLIQPERLWFKEEGQ